MAGVWSKYKRITGAWGNFVNYRFPVKKGRNTFEVAKENGPFIDE